MNEILALEAALGFIQREGLDQRFARHARIAAAFRAGLRALGLELFTGADCPAAAGGRLEGVKK